MDIILSHISALQAYRCDLTGIRCCLDARHETAQRLPLKVSFRPRLARAEAQDLVERAHMDLPVHTLTCGSSHRASEILQTHVVWRPGLSCEYISISRGLNISSPELMFLQLAETWDFASLVALGFEICGHYARRGLSENEEATYDLNPLTTVEDLRKFADSVSGHSGIKKMRLACSYIKNGSRSPKETEAAMRLGLPCMYGGKNFGMPAMNHIIRLDDTARHLADGRSYLECDLYFPEFKLDIEYDSREFHLCADPEKWQSDKNRIKALNHMGIQVIELTNRELSNTVLFDALAQDIAKRFRKRLRPQCKDYPARCANLVASIASETGNLG